VLGDHQPLHSQMYLSLTIEDIASELDQQPPGDECAWPRARGRTMEGNTRSMHSFRYHSPRSHPLWPPIGANG